MGCHFYYFLCNLNSNVPMCVQLFRPYLFCCCCEVLIYEICYKLTFLCSAMRNSSSTSVLGIFTKARVMVETCHIRLSSLLYSELFLDLSRDFFVLVIILAIRLGRCFALELNICPQSSMNASSCLEKL